MLPKIDLPSILVPWHRLPPPRSLGKDAGCDSSHIATKSLIVTMDEMFERFRRRRSLLPGKSLRQRSQSRVAPAIIVCWTKSRSAHWRPSQ